jgi:hypothetical protein
MKISFFKSFIRPSKLLSDREFDYLCKTASILEQDVRGLKVLLLENGNILKIFRLRGLFSSSRVYSNARSFCRNAERLRTLGISTIGKCDLFHLPHSSNTIVIYEPLAGDTLKKLFYENKLFEKDYINVGLFVAKLHNLGIHFKSLHFGNIVRTPTGELGLIDISDMRIFPWKLMLKTRLRGFKRFLRYQEDVKKMGKRNWELVLASYIESSGFKSDQAEYLRSGIDSLNLNL